MSFSSIKQEDNRTKGRVIRIDHNVTGPPYKSTPTSPITVVAGGLSIGSLRATLFNRTKNFHPGQFRINAIDTRSCLAEDSYSEVASYIKRGTQLFVSRELKGNILSQLVSPSWDTTTGYVGKPYDLSLAQVKAMGKYNAPDLDIGMFLAELTETIEMLMNPFEQISRLTKTLTKTKGLPSLKDVSSWWLSNRYGILPLLIFVENTIDHFTKVKERLETKIFRKHGIVLVSDTETVVQNTSDINGVTIVWNRKIQTIDRAISSVYYLDTSLRQNFGSDFDQLPSIILEVIPFSFVLEWFFGVGAWLQANRPTQEGRIMLGNTCGAKRKTVYTAWCTAAYEPTNGIPLSALPGPYKHVTTKYTRSLTVGLPALPLVQPEFLNLVRSFDSVGLALQKIKLPKIGKH